ncbi:uncharacterized protein LOC113002620 [Solenopsis invicta]|uniref:uncharacterized protein LOC113002620 n=1 Tax=Solenopsis invicta TaxID=13686 RepID=UPI000595B69C|nr:uncharacterized protein LOC113002620 [Solenopsis invicta]
MKRIKILNEYYTNLDYNKSYREKALKEIRNLSQTLIAEFNQNINFSKRFQILVNKIHENFFLFASVCKHIDVIQTILEYMTIYIMRFQRNITVEMSQLIERESGFYILLATLFSMCREPAIRSFFYSILQDNPKEAKNVREKVESHITLLDGEMIILEDSDLCAVVKCLIITINLNLYKIWVQKRVKVKFLWLTKKYHLEIGIPIYTFQSLKDLQPYVYPKYTTKIISIWSEDIVAVKNFALSLNSHIIFINTYMDFRDGIMFLPSEIISHSKHETYLSSIRKEKVHDVEPSIYEFRLSHTAEKNAGTIYNLFYNGTWQKPKKRMYWEYNGSLWANASNDDILRCYESAEKGFETWSTKPIKIRTQILSKFVSTLKDNGKIGLAAIIERLLKCPYLYESIQGFRNTKIEVINTRIPLGVIILREKNENVFFLRLIQTLIAGNSVIVMSYDPNFYNFAPYCDMFSTCGIPPGVINLLSHENTHFLEFRLCVDKYVYYANKYFLKCFSLESYILQYKLLTVPKQIILHLV